MAISGYLNSKARIRGLKTLGECYQTGRFDSLESLLSEDCVFESQWVLEPRTGKEAIMDYLHGKGRALRKSGSFPQYQLVELVGNLELLKGQDFYVNGEMMSGSFGLFYEEGKICLLLRQEIDGEVNKIIVDMELDDFDFITRIDLCMPKLFRYRNWTQQEQG